MKPIIAIDLIGTLITSKSWDESHPDWFNYFAEVLQDPSIKEYAKLEDWWPKVHEVMEKYLPDDTKEARTVIARTMFSIMFFKRISSEDVVKEFADYLRKQTKYDVALVTSFPDILINLLLEKMGCLDIFSIVLASKSNKESDKKLVFEEFITKFGKPVYYIGNGNKNIISCKEVGIKTVSVNWLSESKCKGNYDVNSVKELENLIK